MVLFCQHYAEMIDYTSQLPLWLEVANEMEADIVCGSQGTSDTAGRHVLCCGPFFFPVVWNTDEMSRAAVAILHPHGDLENRSYRLRM